MAKLKNLKFDPPVPTALTQGQKDSVRHLLNQLKRLADDKRDLAEDEKALLAELKEKGFPAKAVREALKHAALTQFRREDHERAVDLLKDALGLFADTPLGEAAVKREAAGDVVDLEELATLASEAGVTVNDDGDLVVPAAKKKPGRPPGAAAKAKAARVPKPKASR